MRFLNVSAEVEVAPKVEAYEQVEYEDLAPAMLHAVECALSGAELHDVRARIGEIREGHRSLLADDAERGAALYELFRSDLVAAETAARIAALAPGSIQLK